MGDVVVVLNLVAMVARDNLVVLVAVLGNVVVVGRVAIIRRQSASARDVDADIVVEEKVGALCDEVLLVNWMPADAVRARV